MRAQTVQKHQQSGFTLIELLVVLVIIAILFGITSVNLGQAQSTASLVSITNTLLADLKSQQILAMSGDEGSTNAQQPHGIYVQPSGYTLFADANYNTADTNNFTISVSPNSLQTTFPAKQVIFQPGDGAVTGFNNGDNTITITNQSSSEVITINRFGATVVN